MENILICPPTYGMYSVCAQVNDVGVVKVPLITDDASYQLDVPEASSRLFNVAHDKITQKHMHIQINKVLSQDPTIKVVFLCSPGNPTGTLLTLDSIKSVLENTSYTGVVVVDEAYIDFSVDVNNKTGRCSISEWVLKYPNLIVIQTLSKSFGLAGIR